MSWWTHPVLHVWIATSVAMIIGWLVQLRTRNIGIVDAIWAAAMGASALYYASVGDGGVASRVAVALLGSLWGFRLALHILARVLSEPEDGRYGHLREYWHGDQRKFFGFFMAQAFVTALFSLPFYAVARNPHGELSLWCVLGIGIWIASVAGEAVADAQLSTFRKNIQNRGHTCRAGLWRYSRHPNYFFEWLHWFAYVFLSIGSPVWALSLVGPVLMFISLMWVSGVPFSEAQALRTRGDDYRDYQRTTSVLIPWFPKKA